MKAPLRADKRAKVSMTPALGSQNHTFHLSSSLLKSNDHVEDLHGLQQLHKREEYDNEGGDFFDDRMRVLTLRTGRPEHLMLQIRLM